MELFNLKLVKVRRIDILKEAKNYTNCGLCNALNIVLTKYNIVNNYRDYNHLHIIFPKFTIENAIRFGADPYSAYWWKCGDWTTGRMDFLDWLIDEYKDDTEDLRKMKL